MDRPLLFTPLQIKDVTLKNRVVVAPMHQYSAVEGFATDWHLVNAGKYAQGGAGLVMMESKKVARNGCGTVGDTALWPEALAEDEWHHGVGAPVAAADEAGDLHGFRLCDRCRGEPAEGLRPEAEPVGGKDPAPEAAACPGSVTAALLLRLDGRHGERRAALR